MADNQNNAVKVAYPPPVATTQGLLAKDVYILIWAVRTPDLVNHLVVVAEPSVNIAIVDGPVVIANGEDLTPVSKITGGECDYCSYEYMCTRISVGFTLHQARS